MGQPFIGEIRMFAGNFAPVGWALCDGRLLSIAENDALFSLVGTIYGGDGITTFAVPDLRGRAPLHWGQGPGLTQRQIGGTSGQETVRLVSNQVPAHVHVLVGSAEPGTATSPVDQVPAVSATAGYGPSGAAVPIATESAGQAPAQLFNNRPPQLAVNFILSLYGVYPVRA